MEKFQNIDWNPLLKDVVDNIFVNEERLEEESVMYRIMRGTFQDPFAGIENDYKEAKFDMIKNIEGSVKGVNVGNKKVNGSEGNNKKTNEAISQRKKYVPGIRRPSFKFPRMSDLNKEQQAMCLRVLLRFSNSEKQQMSQIDRDELQCYLDLKDIISQEQDEFLQLAKHNWSDKGLHVVCEEYINLRWKYRIQNIIELPRYYTETTNIPFTASKEVVVRFIGTCLQEGDLSDIIFPTFTRPYMLGTSSLELEKTFPLPINVNSHTINNFKLAVSQDKNCENLATTNDVDLVISSSGLKCLVNNIGPSYSNSWTLPVVIKVHNGKNIIYIDKPVPPSASTIPQKNTWVYKYILRHCLVLQKHSSYKQTFKDPLPFEEENIFEDVNSDEHIKLEEQYKCDKSNIYKEIVEQSMLQNTSKPLINTDDLLCETSIQNENQITDYDRGLQTPVLNTSILKNSDQDEIVYTKEKPPRMKPVQNKLKSQKKKTSCTTVQNNTKKKFKDRSNEVKVDHSTTFRQNVSYNLFSIGPQSAGQNELIKTDIAKEYKILVRTKIDGVEKLPNGTQQLMILAPKLEHQLALGAEAVTLEEGLKQWVSLIFRPYTNLARVRISAETSEVIQIEKRTSISVSNEIKRLYNVKVEDSLTVFHNVIQTLTNISPGRYIIRHTIRNGAFATVYKIADNPGKNVIDLHTVCDKNCFYTFPNTEWPIIDKMVTTPMLKCFERMPAMFCPPVEKASLKKRKYIKKNHINTGEVRRSLRNKKQPSKLNI